MTTMTTATTQRHRTRTTNRILQHIHGKDARMRDAIEAQKLNTMVAELILTAREKAGLTQSQLAKLVGTTQSVIAKLEDADHDGQCLSMLRRIATALNCRVVIRLVATSQRTATRA
jgi:ribosome-binding protein aMBF1 (putative translation factor)